MLFLFVILSKTKPKNVFFLHFPNNCHTHTPHHCQFDILTYATHPDRFPHTHPVYTLTPNPLNFYNFVQKFDEQNEQKKNTRIERIISHGNQIGFCRTYLQWNGIFRIFLALNTIFLHWLISIKDKKQGFFVAYPLCVLYRFWQFHSFCWLLAFTLVYIQRWLNENCILNSASVKVYGNLMLFSPLYYLRGFLVRIDCRSNNNGRRSSMIAMCVWGARRWEMKGEIQE